MLMLVQKLIPNLYQFYRLSSFTFYPCQIGNAMLNASDSEGYNDGGDISIGPRDVKCVLGPMEDEVMTT